ncbi:hypothetical protein HF325_001291 [Metschnikowia pulcherrima]|uniref:Uncharacterized protein n=1 Tax=Metschnikowia pulcherrima TaxID=27326 RepID=A0A8H7GUU1_9ASCO|nr:hypothetical protein HF325_001291 [Metschnikowia pulcherrima]
MNTRKSSRSRAATLAHSDSKQLHMTNQAGHDLKRRKTSNEKAISVPEKEASAAADDKMDPVEKLLSFSHVNQDILLLMNELDQNTAATAPTTTPAYPNILCNFNKVIHDNMRLYYARFGKLHMEIHNDHSSFSVLNQPPAQTEADAPKLKFNVPFFKNVNFNPKPSFGHQIDDYIHYDDEEPLTTDSEHEELALPTGVVETPIPSLSGKMSFHYRQNDKLSLSLSDEQAEDAPNDAFRFLNQRSVLSGKASEMIGTSNFLVSDFFF